MKSMASIEKAALESHLSVFRDMLVQNKISWKLNMNTIPFSKYCAYSNSSRFLALIYARTNVLPAMSKK